MLPFFLNAIRNEYRTSHDENGRKPADVSRIMVGERVAGGRQTLLYVVIWWNKKRKLQDRIPRMQDTLHVSVQVDNVFLQVFFLNKKFLLNLSCCDLVKIMFS